MVFTIGEDSSLSGTIVGEWNSEENINEDGNGYSYEGEYTDEFTLTDLEATIQGSLQTVGQEIEPGNTTEPVTFSGEIVLAVGEYDYLEEETYADKANMDGYSYGWDNTSTSKVNDFSLDLYGGIATKSGDELTLNLSLMGRWLGRELHRLQPVFL